MDFFEFNRLFPTEQDAINYFINIRYKGKMTCPHCGSTKVFKHSKGKFFICDECHNTFSVFKGTIFEKSDTDLRKWFYAINLFLNAKKGISSYQLQREIGVTHKTAWRILKQIRTAMSNQEMKEFIDAVVEMDETYIGGKPRKGNNKSEENEDDEDKKNPPKSKRGRGTKKTPVVGAVDRNSKQIHAKVALPNIQGKALSGKQLFAILEEVCKTSTIVVTDEFRGYNILKHTDHKHLVVNHCFEYANGEIHTNTIESFWSTLKRGVYGIYHKVSVKYLQQYVNEFCFRYNNRGRNMFDLVLMQAVLG